MEASLEFIVLRFLGTGVLRLGTAGTACACGVLFEPEILKQHRYSSVSGVKVSLYC